MRNSEIFNSFAKIAEEQGLISKEPTKKTASDEDLKAFETMYGFKPSKDSRNNQDLKAIEILYGVKTPPLKGLDYENNIVEVAHPEPVVVSLTTDRVNGLVENINERHAIITNRLMRHPNGILTHFRYAQEDLIKTLVSLGNLLDNKNQDELRVLADSCLMQIVPIKKTSWIVPVLGALAGTLGVLWFQQHANFNNEAFEHNHEKLIGELDDFLNGSTNWGLWGHTYKQDLLNMVMNFKSKLTDLFDLFKTKFEPLLTQLEAPDSVEHLMQIKDQPKTGELLKASHDLEVASKDVRAYINQFGQDFKSDSFKEKETQDKGVLNKWIEKVPGLYGGSGLVSDNFDDVLRAIPPYVKSLDELIAKLGHAKDFATNAEQRIASINKPSETPTSEPAKPEDAARQKMEDELSTVQNAFRAPVK